MRRRPRRTSWATPAASYSGSAREPALTGRGWPSRIPAISEQSPHYVGNERTFIGYESFHEIHEIHDLNVRVYYVAQSSVDHARYPALRVKSLTSVAGEPAFTDAEIVPGVEDLQIEFGIDSAAHSGQVSQYVNPDYPGLEAQQIVAVRAWIRVRAEHPEPGFIDAREYHYADVSFVPVGAERALRRVLLSRTITLRNARTS